MSETVTYNYSGGIEYYTVNVTTSLTITAEGAGGGGTGGTSYGGAGANVTGTFDVTAGTVLEIITGGAGTSGFGGDGGGGGGGSFVFVDSGTTAVLLEAAGGGGGGGGIGTGPGADATLTTSAGGSDGLGGSSFGYFGDNGGGGAGVDGGGGGSLSTGGAGAPNISSFGSGVGGANGGFGGGGGGGGTGGGGGGGYSGGDGFFYGGGGGGGSYIDTTGPYAVVGSGLLTSNAVSGGNNGIVILTIATPPQGQIVVSSGGTVFNAGTVLSNLTVASGTTVVVAYDDIVSGLVVASGGTEILETGGADTGSLVEAGGSLLMTGGETTSSMVQSGGTLDVMAGTADHATISSGGTILLSGGTSISGVIMGTELASAGTSLDDTVTGSGATLVVSGGVVVNATVESGGKILEANYFAPGTVESGLKIQSGLSVIEAGTASATIISSGGILSLTTQNPAMPALGVSTVIDGGGTEIISAGATDSATLVQAGGTLVLAGGTTIGATVSIGGTVIENSGASLQSSVIDPGGALTIGPNGTSYSGATIILNAGAVMSGQTISTGVTLIVAGGTAIDVVVQTGGTTVISAGIASATTLSGGATLDLVGGTSLDAMVQGHELVSAGSALNETVLGGGFFSAGNGVVSSLTISSGGSVLEFNATYQSFDGLIVSSGGVFEGQSVTISHLSAVPGGTDQVGQIFIQSGSVTSVIGDGEAGGSVSSGTSIYLVPGTFYYDTTVQSGASITLIQSYSQIAGSASFYESTILSGGYVSASGGSGDVFNVYSNTVSAGGDIFVSGLGGSEFADTIAGTVMIGAGATTSGSSVMAGGTMLVSAAGTDDGTTDGGMLIVRDGAVVSGVLGFAGSGATIELDGTSAVTISGFNPAAGDTIVLSALPFSAGATLSHLGSAVVINDGAVSQTIYMSGLATGATPVLSDDAGSLAIACYAAGTRIATMRGEVPIERIDVGDVLLRARGGNAPVVWAGRRTLDLTRHAESEFAKPVRVLAGAIAPGQPARDLVVSPRHALYIEGALYEAISLVNGATIRQEHEARRVTYHHLELAAHDIIIAEGQPAESYVERGNRHMFEGQESLWLHPRPDAGAMGAACLPEQRAGPALEGLRMRLIARALGMGFVNGDPAAPAVLAGGRRLRPLRAGLYALPPGLAAVVLRSAPFYAGETTSALADKRRLGTALRGARLLCGLQVSQIDLACAAHRGLYPRAAGTVWTDGYATLALPAYRGTAMLQIEVADAPTRLVRAG